MPALPALSARRESSLLLPVAILLLVLLSIVTLASYRSALAAWRQHEHFLASSLAEATARKLAGHPMPSPLDLHFAAPFADQVALTDPLGRVLVASGLPANDEEINPPPAARQGDEAASSGPDATTGGRVLAWQPLVLDRRRLLVRVGLFVPGLASQLRVARILTWLVVGIDLLLALLVLAYVRSLFTPYDELLSRARAQGKHLAASPDTGDGVPPDEETEQMLTALRRALAFIDNTKVGTEPSEDEIAAVSRMLGPNRETGVLIVDRELCLLSLNAAGAALLGVESPATGESLAVALATAPKIVSALEQAFRTQRPIDRLEVEQDRPLRTLGLTVQLLRRDDGSVKGLLALFADASATRRAQSERQLALTLSQLGELAAGVAHELRNSLATINGYLTLIERRPEEGTLADYLGEIRTESDRLQRVVTDFLTFARPGTAQPQPVSLTELVSRAVADPALGSTSVDLGPLPGEEPVLSGDPVLLGHALRNLLTNAATAQQETSPGVPLEVAIERCEDGGWRIAVRDRGPGLSPQIRDHLFQPFVSGDASGVGLGLALAYRILDMHGGRLRITPRAGGGTEAMAILPADIFEYKSNNSRGHLGSDEAEGESVTS